MTVSLRIETMVRAMAPIAHFSGRKGRKPNHLLANRIPFVTDDGAVIDVPAVSGNGFRGQLRDALASEVAEAVGEPLDKRLFHILFSGGKLAHQEDGDKAKTVKVDVLRRIHENPFLDLFGGGLDVMMIRGRLRVGWMIPLTKETTRALDPDYLSWAAVGTDDLPSAGDLLGRDVMHTRRDDARNDLLGGRFLDPGSHVILSDSGLTRKEWEKMKKENSELSDDEWVRKDPARAMAMHFEVIPAHTLMRGTLQATNAGEAAAGGLFAALRRFAMDGACLGGKVGSGYGEVSMKARLMDSGENVFTLGAGRFRLEERFRRMEDAFREWMESVSLDDLRRAAAA